MSDTTGQIRMSAHQAIAENLQITVTVSGVYFALWRLRITMWMLRAAQWVSGCDMSVNLERSRRS